MTQAAARRITERGAAAGALARLLEKADKARGSVDNLIEFAATANGKRIKKQFDIHREWQKYWEDEQFSVLMGPVFHGKSTQARYRILRSIGENPDTRIAWIGVTEKLPKKLLGSLKQDILGNSRYHFAYPHVKPAEGSRRMWTSDQILIDRVSTEPDPTIQVFGLFGSILGSRIDEFWFDDIMNLVNTLTEYQRDKVWDWIESEVITRMTHETKIRVIGHPWDEDDSYQRFRKLEDFAYRRYSAFQEDEEEELLLDEDGEPTPLIPEMWTVEQVRKREKMLGPVRSTLMLHTKFPAKHEGRMRKRWFEECLKRGRGMAHTWKDDDGVIHVDFSQDIPLGVPIYTGVDLGHKKKAGSDYTSLYTFALLPNGDRQLIDLRSGRWSGPEIIGELANVKERFGSTIGVEDNGGQTFLIEWAEDTEVLSLRSIHTGTNKYAGIENLGIEFSNARWILPCSHEMVPPPEVLKFIDECLGYDPKAHTGDRLMAAWIGAETCRNSPAATQAVALPLGSELQAR